MASHYAVAEFRDSWLPHVSNAGLRRLIDLLGKANPLLIHGAFTRSVPMGCPGFAHRLESSSNPPA